MMNKPNTRRKIKASDTKVYRFKEKFKPATSPSDKNPIDATEIENDKN